MKSDHRPNPLPPPASTMGSTSKKSAASSVQARKKLLELEAAREKARIQMDLIDKKLEADLAVLDEENYSPHEERSTTRDSAIERWMEQSQQEQQKPQLAPEYGTSKGKLCQLPAAAAAAVVATTTAAPVAAHPPGDPTAGPATATAPSGTDGTIQMLASAIKDLAASTTADGPSSKMLSRLCIPKELPSYNGDPMEWLSFRQAYQESTETCRFTDQENLWRLRKSLCGAAKEAVAALLMSAASPQTIMETLELRFGNPDIIVSKIVQELKRLHPVSQDYHHDIVPFAVKVMNYVAAVRALGQHEYLGGSGLVTVILSKLPAVLISKWADYSYAVLPDNTKPKLVILAEFLNCEAIKISKTAANLSIDFHNIKRNTRHNYPHAVLVQSETVSSENKCNFCRTSVHKLIDCRLFKKALRKDRWRHVKQYGVCYKCLVSRHDRETCPAPVCDRENCGQMHHRLLHYPINNNARQQSNVNITELQSEPKVETVTHLNTGNSTKVLLKVVPIKIHGPSGEVSTIAMLDDGSTVTLISAALAARVGLSGSKQSIRVCGAWQNNELVCESEMVNFDVSNRNGTMWSIHARSVSELNLPTQSLSSVDIANYGHISSEIKTQLCEGQSRPEMLIGQDNYDLLLPLQIIKGKANEPYATRTPLGWCIHGCARAPPPAAARAQYSTLHVTCESCDHGVMNLESERILNDIHEDVRRSFTIESMGVSNKPRENSEDLRATAHLEQTSTLMDGRWHVSLPWKDVDCKMPNSHPNALTRLRGVIKKMQADEGYSLRYRERVQHLFQNDFAKQLVSTEVTPKTWYLPHFGVDNPNKKKLRLVFDAAAKANGRSLNDYLYKGPDLLMSLFGIMLRFRENPVAVTGDIKDMFLRIKIIPEDQNALRFLWRNGPDGEVKTYAMTSLIFGASCSPFIAQFVKNKNALRYESSMPDAVAAIHKQHYMDDYIDSLPNESAAVEMVKNITHIHSQGGFNIVNWNTNCAPVLDGLPKESLGTAAVKFRMNQEGESERTLGLLWYPTDDSLGFDISFKRIPERLVNGTQKPTKREMLRIIMSIFDVYGFLSPFTIKGKIMLQDTWRSDLNWDDLITNELSEKWVKWLEQLRDLSTLRLPRYYRAAAAAESESEMHDARPPPPPPPSSTQRYLTNDSCERAFDTHDYINLQLHVFCDASTRGMCAVAYWRWTNKDVRIAFIASKCRVAPVKHTSMPRLELQAALLAARLTDTIKREHRLTVANTYLWSDSSTVLHWIRNDARNYKTYVAHRLGEIDELTNKKDWRYVPTKKNVADLATRDTCDVTIFQKEWFRGPTFLYSDEEMWPTGIQLPEVRNMDLECVMTTHVAPRCLPAVPDPARFSSWLRLLKSTSVVISFVEKKCKKLTGEVNRDLMDRAERLIIRYAQVQSFTKDLDDLEKKKHVERGSRLLTLSPFLDEHGVMRVGGRINAAPEITAEVKQPVILDGRSEVARLIVRYYHVQAAHGNQETVVNNLKQKYWIIKIRPTVKHVTSKCMFCRIRKAQPEPPRMGDLPEARLAHHQRAFTHCGLDLFGYMEVTVGRRREKRYGVLFTCLTVRAIHIEMVSDLTTDALIMALRRMAARRGWPLYLYSDNGTNLRGADAEIKKSIMELNQDKLKTEALNYGTTWTFIPPASPHWGGAWERLVRSVKTSLKVVLKERTPRDEVLSTLMTEVEQIVNGRPLTHVSVEPTSNEALTPNHFLLGSSSNLPTMGTFNDSDLRKRWRISQRLADMFWKRWVREVLPELRPRRKWQKEERPLQVGDLVLIVDPDSPRNVWPRGIVETVYPGKDGRIRVIDVRTNTRVLKRSAARVVRILMGDEC